MNFLELTKSLSNKDNNSDFESIIELGKDELSQTEIKELIERKLEKSLVDNISALDVRDSDVILNVVDLLSFVQNESKDWEDPPYDPNLWALRFEFCTRLRTGLLKKAKSLFSEGFYIEIIDEETMKESTKKKAEKQKLLLEKFFQSPDVNEKETNINGILKKIYLDRGTTGTGFMDVARNKLGRISSISHLRSLNTRNRSRRKEEYELDAGCVFFNFKTDKKDFLSRRSVSAISNKKIYIKKFGDTRGLNKETGEFSSSPNFLSKNEANEVIRFFEYVPGVVDYGIPDGATARFAIDANFLISLQNISFLKNNSTPRLIFIVTNGALNTKDINRLDHFLKVSGAGPENAGKALVLQPTTKHQGLPNAHIKEANIKIEKVGITSIDDASYPRYRKDNNSEISEAVEVPELFFSAEGGGKAAASTIDKFFLEKIIQPEAKDIENLINNTLVRDLLTDNKMVDIEKSMKENNLMYFDTIEKIIEDNTNEFMQFSCIKEIRDKQYAIFENKIYVRFRLLLPRTKDELIEARILRLLQDLNVMTPNDINKLKGKKIIDEPWANRPLKIIELALENGADPELLLGLFDFKKAEQESENSENVEESNNETSTDSQEEQENEN